MAEEREQEHLVLACIIVSVLDDCMAATDRKVCVSSVADLKGSFPNK